MFFKENDVILFQGDSITDCGRDRNDPANLGGGYAFIIASRLQALYPQLNLKFYNTGISGNRVCDLEGRWQKDCLDLKPTVLSVLIGVNDAWRRYDSNNPTSAADYEAGYRRIITTAKEKLGCRVVIMEPFLLHSKEGQELWREDLDPKIQAARKVAADLADAFVALDGPLTAAAVRTGPAYWLPDGVHPNGACRAFIAQKWLEAVGALPTYF